MIAPPKKIVVASHNPVKLSAVQRGFARVFPADEFRLDAVSVTAGVRSQPLSDEEALQGAVQRAQAAADLVPGADYWVGIEGGVEERTEGMLAFAWAAVLSQQRIGRGRTGAFFLPEAVARLVREGLELGEADDRVFGRSNSKQGEGAVGILTGGLIDRTRLYEDAVILALIPFRNEGLYSSTEVSDNEG